MTDDRTEAPETAALAKPAPGALAPDVQARSGMMLTDDAGAMQPKDLAELMEFSRILANSDLVPKDYKGKAGNVLVAIQMGSELGLRPMQAIQNIAVINGRPSLWGDAMLAVVRAHPQFGSIQEMDLADITEAGAAVCVLVRKGEAPHTSTFSVEDAKRAGLWGKTGPWSTYPSRMLQMRARSFACRNVFPDALRGLQSAEEVRDIPTVEAVATVLSSGPSDIVNRLKERRDTGPGKVLQAETESDDDPNPAPPADPGNGELSPEGEAAMDAERGTQDGAGQ